VQTPINASSFIQGVEMYSKSEMYQEITSPGYAAEPLESDSWGQRTHLAHYSEVSPQSLDAFYQELSAFDGYNQDNPPELM
jgi:hypothetical protein